MKKCSNCFQLKPLTEFYVKRWKGKEAHQSRCKACNAEVVRGYRRRKQHPWGQAERRKTA